MYYKMAATNISREDIKMLYAILGETDDFFRMASNGGFDLQEKKNICAWPEKGGLCGKMCEDLYCYEHMLKLLAGHRPPFHEIGNDIIKKVCEPEDER